MFESYKVSLRLFVLIIAQIRAITLFMNGEALTKVIKRFRKVRHQFYQ